MITEKDRMKAVDGKGRTFKVLGNTENGERDIVGNTCFEDLIAGDLFISYDGLELNVCNGSFIYLVLEPPHMADDVPTLKAHPISLQQIKDLCARPPIESKGNDLKDVEVTTPIERKARQFVNDELAKGQASADNVTFGKLMNGYSAFLGLRKATTEQVKALFDVLAENYDE